MRSNLECLATPVFARHYPAANTAAVITIAASSEQYWALDWAMWSYSEEPTAGRLTVAIGGTTYLDIDITSAGPGPLRFDPPVYNPAFTKGEAMVITLAAGGGTCVGKLSARYR